MKQKERKAEILRKTKETSISLSLNIDGSGSYRIDTGIGFMDHMLVLFAMHGLMDLEIKCEGDTFVDDHHSTEDIGIALGTAFREALGDKRGIVRYGDIVLPMDEALLLVAVDISGRSSLNFDVEMPTEKVGSFDTELCEEFWLAFASNAGLNLHIVELYGRNSHHIIEGIYKAAARALRKATALDDSSPESVPSTKGVLS